MNLPIERLDPSRYLPFEPVNEFGVIYVFALTAEKLGFEVERIRGQYPDCAARWRGKRRLIEFEFRSSNFKRHGHDPSKCDLVVCWEHDWAGMPVGLSPIELRKLFGMARDVWVVAYQEEFWEHLPPDRKPARGLWSVPARAGVDDVLLVYRPRTGHEEGAITDVFRVHTPPERVKRPGWRREPDWMADIQRIAELGKPIPFSRLKKLRASGGLENRPRKTEHWPKLYREISERAEPSHSVKRYRAT